MTDDEWDKVRRKLEAEERNKQRFLIRVKARRAKEEEDKKQYKDWNLDTMLVKVLSPCKYSPNGYDIVDLTNTLEALMPFDVAKSLIRQGLVKEYTDYEATKQQGE